MALSTTVGIRIEESLREEGKKWLEELNQGRRFPLTETDLLRALLTYAIRHRIPWESGPIAPGDAVELWDAVNEYVRACGGNVSKVSGARMDAVVKVNRELERLRVGRR